MINLIDFAWKVLELLARFRVFTKNTESLEKGQISYLHYTISFTIRPDYKKRSLFPVDISAEGKLGELDIHHDCLQGRLMFSIVLWCFQWDFVFR